MSEKLPKVQLYFRFYGDSFDPDEISRRLGLIPTTSYKPGDVITKDGKGKRLGYGWVLKVDGGRTIEIDDLLREFRQQVDVSPTLVRQVSQKLGVQPAIVCGVGAEAADVMPALVFPDDFIGWAADLGAALYVDVIA